jgi:hypothetical protein
MKDLKQFIKTTIREFLNEKNITTEDIYYHGSPNYFSVKDIKPNDKGLIFFSKDKNIAVRYATNDFSGNKLGYEYNIIKARLDVKKIFDPEKHDNNSEIIELLSNTGNFQNVGRFPDYETLASEALYNGEWSVLETKEFIDGLKEMGYDSILIDNRPHYVPNFKGEQTFNRDIAVFNNNVIIPI